MYSRQVFTNDDNKSLEKLPRILAKFGTKAAFDLVMPACCGISGADRVFPFFFCLLVIPQCEDLDRPFMHDVVCPSPVANRIFFNAMQMYNTWGGGNWEK